MVEKIFFSIMNAEINLSASIEGIFYSLIQFMSISNFGTVKNNQMGLSIIRNDSRLNKIFISLTLIGIGIFLLVLIISLLRASMFESVRIKSRAIISSAGKAVLIIVFMPILLACISFIATTISDTIFASIDNVTERKEMYLYIYGSGNGDAIKENLSWFESVVLKKSPGIRSETLEIIRNYDGDIFTITSKEFFSENNLLRGGEYNYFFPILFTTIITIPMAIMFYRTVKKVITIIYSYFLSTFALALAPIDNADSMTKFLKSFIEAYISLFVSLVCIKIYYVIAGIVRDLFVEWNMGLITAVGVSSSLALFLPSISSIINNALGLDRKKESDEQQKIKVVMKRLFSIKRGKN